MILSRKDFAVDKPIEVALLTAELKEAGISGPKVSFLGSRAVRFFGLSSDDELTAKSVVEAHQHSCVVAERFSAPLVDGSALQLMIMALPSVKTVRFIGNTDRYVVWVHVNPDADMAAVRAVIRAHVPDVLGAEKADGFLAADTTTLFAIESGFPFDEKVHSLSTNAQLNLLSLLELDRMGAIDYPELITSKGDGQVTNLKDSARLVEFCKTGLLAVRGAIAKSQVIKDNVRSASTLGEAAQLRKDAVRAMRSGN